jgi:hypothetical protein
MWVVQHWCFAPRCACDQPGHLAALLFGDWAYPTHQFAVEAKRLRRITNDEDVWMARRRQVCHDLHSVGAVGLDAESVARRRAHEAGSPDDAVLDPVGVDRDAVTVAVAVGNAGSEHDIDTACLQRPVRRL